MEPGFGVQSLPVRRAHVEGIYAGNRACAAASQRSALQLLPPQLLSEAGLTPGALPNVRVQTTLLSALGMWGLRV